MELILAILKDTAVMSLNTIYKLALIIFALLVIIELLREYRLMETITRRLRGAAKLLGIPAEGMIGVVVGLLGGLSYSSSIMYDLTRDLNLTQTQLNTMYILVGICHSIIEETALYATSGANSLLGLACRTAFGLIAVTIYRLATKRRTGIL